MTGITVLFTLMKITTIFQVTLIKLCFNHTFLQVRFEFPFSNLFLSSNLSGNTNEHVIRNRKQEIWDSMDEETRETYGKDYLDNIYSYLLNSTHKFPRDLTPVIRCMRSSLLSKRPRERYPCGTGADLLMNLYPLLPIWLTDSVTSAIGFLPKIYKPALLSNQQ